MSQDAQPPAVLYHQDGAVALLTLNQPKRRNALNRAVERDLLAALDRVRDDASVRAVVLTGAGKSFCAGADLTSFDGIPTPQQVHDHLVDVYGPIVERIVTLDKPVLGAINGIAAGAGCSLALACDLRVMADDAAFVLAFSNIGLVPDAGAAWFLARQIGYSRAFEMAATAQPVGAEACLAQGLTNRVVPAVELVDATLAWAHELAARPTFALGRTKRVLHTALNATLHDTIAFEAEMQKACAASNDHVEGLMAFLEKRPPEFTGT